MSPDLILVFELCNTLEPSPDLIGTGLVRKNYFPKNYKLFLIYQSLYEIFSMISPYFPLAIKILDYSLPPYCAEFSTGQFLDRNMPSIGRQAVGKYF